MRRLWYLWRMARWLDRREPHANDRAASISVGRHKVEVQLWADVARSCKTVTGKTQAGALKVALAQARELE